VGTLVGGGVGVWSLSWASDVVSMEADVAMGALAFSEEETGSEGKASSIEF
jgi:hypothetical protein